MPDEPKDAPSGADDLQIRDWAARGYVIGATVEQDSGRSWASRAIITHVHPNGALDVVVSGKRAGWSARFCKPVPDEMPRERSERKCCDGHCLQGRDCPLRERAPKERRKVTTWRWLLYGWLLHGERRDGFDRRQRVDLGDTGKTLFGLPIIIDDSVAPGHAEFRSGRRRVDTNINVKEEK
jgi:hypothetical protein